MLKIYEGNNLFQCGKNLVCQGMEKNMLDKHEMKNATDKIFSPESV